MVKTLETALIRVALVKKIHLHQEVDAEGKKESIDDRWKLVAEDVFRQPEFAGYEGSHRTIREKYNQIIKEVKARMGWGAENGGKTGNLSDYAGELSELEANVRQILIDKEEETSKKDLKKQ